MPKLTGLLGQFAATACCLHSLNAPDELRQWLCYAYSYSAINIVLVIIIILPVHWPTHCQWGIMKGICGSMG